MSDNEDDKATVVINLNELKKLKEQKEVSVSPSDIDFTTTEVQISTKVSVILFDFKSDFFKENLSTFPNEFECKIVNDLVQLNKELADKNKKIVVFNYNADPKAVNQLCSQIRIKFSNVNTLIIAKGLSEEKAKAHQESKSGANAYLSYPFSTDQLMTQLSKII